MQILETGAGANVSLPCPKMDRLMENYKGQNLATLGVKRLEWFCRGCVDSGSGPSSGSSTQSEVKLVSFSDSGTIILLAPDRIYLSSSNLSLMVSPVVSSDSGDFFCIVDEDRQPDQITKLIVQGKNDLDTL